LVLELGEIVVGACLEEGTVYVQGNVPFAAFGLRFLLEGDWSAHSWNLLGIFNLVDLLFQLLLV
jgi:hypothetical protein